MVLSAVKEAYPLLSTTCKYRKFLELCLHDCAISCMFMLQRQAVLSSIGSSVYWETKYDSKAGINTEVALISKVHSFILSSYVTEWQNVDFVSSTVVV